MLLLNILLNFIISNYFQNHRCLLIFTDDQFDYTGDLPAVKLQIINNSINFNLIFHYFGCQGIIIYSEKPAEIFQQFEAQIKLNLERFNTRRYLVVAETDSFFKLEELDYVSDLLVVAPNSTDFSFILKTHRYVGDERNNEIIFLDKWFGMNRSFLLDADLYPDKLSNQMGRPLKMATFTYEPYTIIGDSTVQSQGTEMRSVLEFSLKLNMTPVAVINEKDYWGEIFANWSGNGLLGNLVTDQADLGFAALYTWESCYHFLDLTKPLVRTGITCLVPAPKPAARWLTPFFSYSPQLWIFVAVFFLVSTTILTIILFLYNHSKILRKKSSKLEISSFLQASIKIVIKPVLLQSLGRNEIPHQLASKLVMGLVLILSLFLTSTYSSGLATVMTVPRYEDAINTIEDFARSELNWGATQDAWLISIQNAKEPNYIKIISTFTAMTEEELKAQSYTGNFAFPIERLPFENFAIGEYIGEDVIGNFHLMEEDLYWEHCVLMIRKNSILLPSLDLFILQIFEAGLISKWQSKAVEMYMNINVQRVVKYYRHHQIEHKVVKLNWSHVEGAFAVLLLGHCISFVVFVVEIFTKKKRKPFIN